VLTRKRIWQFSVQIAIEWYIVTTMMCSPLSNFKLFYGVENSSNREIFTDL